MKLLVNRNLRKFLIQLVLVLVIGIVAFQTVAYINALRFKSYIITHDYELAGYLEQAHPELALEIQAAFTVVKSSADVEAGKGLLKQSGYKHSTELSLIPQANSFYKLNMAAYLVLTVLLGFAILLTVILFLKSHFEAIDQYSDDINRIMEGHTSARLEDSGEGSLSKLAALINVMTSSLYAHIEKEKQNRVFMKDILENVSHQLKTPLSALTMYNEIMRDEDAHNEVISKFLGKSVNELERMQTLIASLLKLARLDAGIIELNKKSYSLKDIIGQMVESFEIRMQKEQKTFEVKAESSILYNCDREWMHEALSNLFKNSVEHTNPGNHIRVMVEETPLIVKIIVEDNGEGIHPDDINYIFKRFYRSKFSQNKQGTGIGLTLAKTIIEMHEGFISVESILKRGTKFTVHLPNLQNCKL
ncbi:MAG: HAMP domain-containing sensor histidine kinase [Clostridiaceae bacterium]|nr:HAMP domain-containing sensor histidine kinase [Clostridiaceae bacterium]